MYEIKTITLDLDDTLWAIGPVIERAERLMNDWLRQHYPRIVETFEAPDVAELRALIAAEHHDRAHDMTFLRRAVLARMGVDAGYGDHFVDDAFRVFEDARNTLELYPDVRPVLESLRRRYRLIAVTNGNARLDRIGIDDLFDDYVSAVLAGAAKPARAIFDRAVAAGGADAGQTLHVGDHPEHDIAGARDAGLRTVWVNRHGRDWPANLAQPDGIVADLRELDRLLMATSEAR